MPTIAKDKYQGDSYSHADGLLRSTLAADATLAAIALTKSGPVTTHDYAFVAMMGVTAGVVAVSNHISRKMDLPPSKVTRNAFISYAAAIVIGLSTSKQQEAVLASVQQATAEVTQSVRHVGDEATQGLENACHWINRGLQP